MSCCAPATLLATALCLCLLPTTVAAQAAAAPADDSDSGGSTVLSGGAIAAIAIAAVLTCAVLARCCFSCNCMENRRIKNMRKQLLEEISAILHQPGSRDDVVFQNGQFTGWWSSQTRYCGRHRCRYTLTYRDDRSLVGSGRDAAGAFSVNGALCPRSLKLLFIQQYEGSFRVYRGTCSGDGIKLSGNWELDNAGDGGQFEFYPTSVAETFNGAQTSQQYVAKCRPGMDGTLPPPAIVVCFSGDETDLDSPIVPSPPNCAADETITAPLPSGTLASPSGLL